MTAVSGGGDRGSAEPAVRPEKIAPRVPGVGAPSSDVLKIWNSMSRWLLNSSASFAKFVQSLHGLSPVEGDTVLSLWPMPVPFPECWCAEGANSADLPFPQRALRKLLNLVVAALSWLHMGRPKVAPRQMALYRPVSTKQWRVVRRFERLVTEVHHTQMVTFKDMGRNATKVESLDSTLQRLHEAAAELGAEGYEGVRSTLRSSMNFSSLGHE